MSRDQLIIWKDFGFCSSKLAKDAGAGKSLCFFFAFEKPLAKECNTSGPTTAQYLFPQQKVFDEKANFVPNHHHHHSGLRGVKNVMQFL